MARIGKRDLSQDSLPGITFGLNSLIGENGNTGAVLLLEREDRADEAGRHWIFLKRDGHGGSLLTRTGRSPKKTHHRANPRLPEIKDCFDEKTCHVVIKKNKYKNHILFRQN